MYAGYDIRCIIYEEDYVLAIARLNAFGLLPQVTRFAFPFFTRLPPSAASQMKRLRSHVMVDATHFRKMHLAFLLNEETVC